MADIYLLIEGQQQGPYTAVQLADTLAQGLISKDLPAWHEGLTEWVALSTLLENTPQPAIPQAPPPFPAQKEELAPYSGHAIATLVCMIVGMLLFPWIGLFGFIPAGIESYLAERSIRKHGYRGRIFLKISMWLLALTVAFIIIAAVVIAVSH
jgi:hypothetical protein